MTKFPLESVPCLDVVTAEMICVHLAMEKERFG